MRGFVAAIFACVLLFQQSAEALEERRVALVIGNSDYENTTPLQNPNNDARDIGRVLESLGFEVVLGLDLTGRQMRGIIRDFADKLRNADVGLLFYAGHALQVNDVNYLAPIDARIEHEGDLDFETIPLRFVLKHIEREVKTVLIFLDACRDNPLALPLLASGRSTRAGRGLARIDIDARKEGTYVAFATEPGSIALDGSGRNSPFTKALLDNIERPGIDLPSLMTDVRLQVYEETNRRQIPWTSSSLLGRFYFAPATVVEAAPSAPVAGSGAEALRPEPAEPPVAEVQGAAEDVVAAVTPDQIPDVVAPLAGRELNVEVQKELRRLGCDPGSPDGIWGRRSQSAFERFLKHTPVRIASTGPDFELLLKLRELKASRVCPVVCSVRHVVRNGRCVLRSCPSGQRLSSKGNCYTPKAAANAQSTGGQSSQSNQRCFEFNGQRICE